MKKFTKILVVLASICLLVGIVALAVSANTPAPVGETSNSELQFFVRGVEGEDGEGGFETLEAAITAAAGKTIYLNRDWTVEAGYSGAVYTYGTPDPNTNADSNGFDTNYQNVGANKGAIGVKISDTAAVLDLNGKTVTQSFDGALFALENASLKLIGSATFVDVRAFVTVSNGSSLVIDTMGEIAIQNTEGRNTLFTVSGSASSLKITGLVTVQPKEEGTLIFDVNRVVGTGSHKIVFDMAKVVVAQPMASSSSITRCVNQFLRSDVGADIDVINGSHIEMTYGKLFKFLGSYKSSFLDLKGFMDDDMTVIDGATAPTIGVAAESENAKILFDAKDSSLIVNDDSYKNAGTFLSGCIIEDGNKSPFIANIDNCYLQSHGATFYGVYSAYSRANNPNGSGVRTGFKALYHQISVTNTEIKRNTKADYFNAGLTIWGVNAKFENCSIDLGDKTKICMQAIAYAEVSDGFVGLLINECKFKTSSSSAIAYNTDLDNLQTTLPDTYMGVYYRNWGTRADNVFYLEDGELVKYNAVFSSDPDKLVSDTVGGADTSYIYYSSTGDGTIDYNRVGDTASGSLGYNMYFWSPFRGTAQEAVDDYGNDVFKHVISPTSGDEGRHGFQVFQSVGGATYGLYNMKYTVSEFDVASLQDDEWFSETSSHLQFNAMYRTYCPRYSSSGSYLGNTGTNVSLTPILINHDGSVKAFDELSDVILPAGGDWSRIVIVSETLISEPQDIPIPTYNAKGDSSSNGGTINKECVELTLNVYVYIDGVLVGTKLDALAGKNHFYGDSGKWLPTDNPTGPFADDLRIWYSIPEGEGYMLDNSRVLAFGRTKYASDFDLELYDSSDALLEDINGHKYINTQSTNYDSTNLPPAPAVGSVDGVEYNDEDEFIAAIKDGSDVELFIDLTKPIDIDGKTFIMKLNGCNPPVFASETYSGKYYSGLGLVKYAPAESDEIFEVVFKEDRFGIDKTVTLTLGSTFTSVLTPEVMPAEPLPYDGFFNTIVSWISLDGNSTIDVFDAWETGKVYLVANVSTEPYFYTVQPEGGAVSYFHTAGDKEAFSDNVNAVIAQNPDKAIFVVLWENTAPVGESAELINIAAGTKLYIDINGKELSVPSGKTLIGAASGSEIYIYSEKEGAEIYGGEASTLVFAQSELSDTEDAEIIIGGVENAAFGIAADGDNLTLAMPVLAACSCDGTAAAEIKISGGLYYSDSASSAAFISASGKANIAVSDIIYIGTPAFISSVTAPITAEISNSQFVSVTDKGELAKGNIIAQLSQDSSVTFADCDISGGFDYSGAGKVSFSAGCQISYPELVVGNANVSAAEGYAIANARYEYELMGVMIPVGAYVDALENLAKITWYNSDKTTVIGTTYNAPIGEIIDGENYEARVTPIDPEIGSEWYKVRFTNWNMPKLSGAGEYEVFPVCKTPVADIKCLKANLTAYTYFRLNYYLPVDTSDVEGLEVLGIFEDLEGTKPLPYTVVTLDGVECYMYNEWPGAADVSVNSRYVHFMIGETLYVDEFEFGVPSYVSAVLADPTSTEAERKLVVNTARYSNESYKLANGGVGLDAYEEILAAYSSLLVNYDDIKMSTAYLDAASVDTSKLAKHMAGARFVFATSQPRFVFAYNTAVGVKAPADGSGNIGEWPEHNAGVFTHLYWETYNGGSADLLASHIGFAGSDDATAAAALAGVWGDTDTVYAMTDNLYICDVTAKLHLAVYAEDGTVVRGTYSLAAYIEALEAAGDMEFYNASMALYALSIAAQEYGSSTYID